jgi:hypothetical protein
MRRGESTENRCGNLTRAGRNAQRIERAMKVFVRRLVKGILVALAVIVGIFALMQLVPYGRTHSNPPVIKEPAWISPRIRELTVRACFDCHSNETRWPWYANVAPFSWVVEFDIEVARSVVNFSEWNRTYPLAPYSGQSIVTGNMPTLKYRLAHPEANLTPEETRELARGLDAMLMPAGR